MTTVERHIAAWLHTTAGIVRRGEDPEAPVRLPVPVYVLHAAGECVLVDTGPHPAAVTDPEGHYGRPDPLGPFRFEAGEPVDVSGVTLVVLTHLHFDHAGGLSHLVPALPVVLQRREWEAAQDPAAAARNFFLPRDYEGLEDRLTLVDGDHDLLGDGTVRLLSTPGHTPGHQSVLVDDALVLAGDVVHYASSLDDGRLPVFGDDLAEQSRSAARLRALRDGGATVVPSHDDQGAWPPDLSRPA